MRKAWGVYFGAKQDKLVAGVDGQLRVYRTCYEAAASTTFGTVKPVTITESLPKPKRKGKKP